LSARVFTTTEQEVASRAEDQSTAHVNSPTSQDKGTTIQEEGMTEDKGGGTDRAERVVPTSTERGRNT